MKAHVAESICQVFQRRAFRMSWMEHGKNLVFARYTVEKPEQNGRYPVGSLKVFYPSGVCDSRQLTKDEQEADDWVVI